jgi:glucokinase
LSIRYLLLLTISWFSLLYLIIYSVFLTCFRFICSFLLIFIKCYNLAMDHYFAVDVGGTKTRVAIFPEDGIKPLEVRKVNTVGKKGTPAERLAEVISDLWPEKGKVRAIGLAAPGYLDPATGIVLSAPNIPGWVQFPLRQFIEDRFKVPVLLGNDANLAALGEWRYGAGKGHHDILYLTISTGIGGGVIVGDQLMLGHNGLAGELGHITVMPDGPKCGCGHRGHLEALSSGTAIAKYVAEQLEIGAPSSLCKNPPPTSYEIALAAEKGDPLAREALTRAGNFLGIALANLLHIFNPSIVILGGGVSRSGPLLIEPMRATLTRNVLSLDYIRDLEIATSALGDDSGLIGALVLARSLTQ